MGGQVVPHFDEAMLNAINAARFRLLLEPASMNQVVIHFLHRLGAAATAAVVVAANVDLRRRPAYAAVRRLLTWVNWLLVVQGTLGALTVLTARSPLIASLHVLVGAALLGLTLWCLLRCLPVAAATGAAGLRAAAGSAAAPAAIRAGRGAW